MSRHVQPTWSGLSIVGLCALVGGVACGSDAAAPADTEVALADSDATGTDAPDSAVTDPDTVEDPDTVVAETVDDPDTVGDVDTDADDPDGGDGVDGDAGDDGEVVVEPTPLEPLFTTRAVHQIAFTLPAADWEVMRHQARSVMDMFVGDCQADPHVSPFTWAPARMVIDGVAFDDVGLRKKGWIGSVEGSRPSLKVKLDKYVDGQAVVGHDDLILNNARQDGARVRQCLGYALFEAAGVPAPRCGFARVAVNGEDLGVYVLLEAVDPDFLKARFARPEGPMYEGVFSDFRTGWLGSFEPETDAATLEKPELAAVAALLEQVPPPSDEALVAGLEALIDLDAFMSFWAVESIVRHLDGYANRGNNFHVYRDPADGRLVFIPHGIDHILDPELGGSDPTTAAYGSAALSQRLLAIPATRARYVARLESLLADVWSAEALTADIDAMAAVLLPHMGPGAGDASTVGSFAWHVARVRTFVAARAGQVEASLATAPPPPGALVPSVCWPAIGTFEGAFTTPFGNFFGGPAGTATFTVTLGEETLTFAAATARSGAIGADTVIVNLAATTAEGTWRLGLEIPRARFAPGALALDWSGITATLYRPGPGGVQEQFAAIGPGTLTLVSATATNGKTIEGSVSGTITDSAF